VAAPSSTVTPKRVGGTGGDGHYQRELTARIEAVCRDAACARPDEMVVDLLRVIGRAIVRALMEGADAARAPLARAYARMLAGGSVHTSDS
jgi:hypothetical protein